MPVSVQYVKERVDTLASVGQAGYDTTQEFNLGLKSAQTTMFEYYVKQFRATQRIHDALRPFEVSVNLTLTPALDTSTTPLPSNYGHELEVSYRKVINNCDPPIIRRVPSVEMYAHEEAYTVNDPVRKPSLAKNIIRHTYKNGLIHVYPKELTNIDYKYLRLPIVPLNTSGLPNWYVTIINITPTDDSEAYDPVNSTDLEWPEQEGENFVDLLLFYLGVQIKDNPIVEYARLKQKENWVG